MSDNKSTALAVIPRSMSEVEALARVYAASALLPSALRNKPGTCS